MNKLLQSPVRIIGVFFVFAIGLGLTHATSPSAQKKEARVTEIVRDVRLLLSQAAARPAALNENLREGTAVRTGNDSRAELTFIDQSLTRLGANTVFSFGRGTHTYDLGSGAILMYAPERAGEVKIRASAATAAITGFTVMIESHPKGLNKFAILHGKGKVSFDGLRDEPCRLHEGQMIVWHAHPRTCPRVLDIDISKLLNGNLARGFKRPLPELDIILAEIKNQETEPPSGGLIDPTNQDTLDQRAAASGASGPPGATGPTGPTGRQEPQHREPRHPPGH